MCQALYSIAAEYIYLGMIVMPLRNFNFTIYLDN